MPRGRAGVLNLDEHFRSNPQIIGFSNRHIYQQRLRLKTDPSKDQHAGEREASEILYLRPDLVKLDRGNNESGENLKRLNLSNNLYTGIWWYSSYPNHYAGDQSFGSNRLGKIITENTVSYLVDAIREVKNDSVTIRMQNKFFDEVKQ